MCLGIAAEGSYVHRMGLLNSNVLYSTAYKEMGWIASGKYDLAITGKGGFPWSHRGPGRFLIMAIDSVLSSLPPFFVSYTHLACFEWRLCFAHAVEQAVVHNRMLRISGPDDNNIENILKHIKMNLAGDMLRVTKDSKTATHQGNVVY